MPTWTPAERRGIYLVVDRLRLLKNSWQKGVSIGDIEHLAGHLRELLVHNAYNKAWNLVKPVQPMRAPIIVAPAIEALAPKEKYHWSRIAFAQTAGLALPGRHMWMPLMLMKDAEIPNQQSRASRVSDIPDKESPSLDEARRAGIPASAVEFGMRGAIMSGLIDQDQVPLWPGSCYKQYRLKNFLSSVCLIHNGRAFTRRELVNYYANKYGGVHIEWKESGDEHRAMAEAGTGLTISQRSPVLYELLSIGQMLANSTDAKGLQEAAEDSGI